MVEGETDEEAMEFRLMADACPEMVFQYRNQFWEKGADGSDVKTPQASMTGSTWLHRSLKVSGSFGLIGVCLYPYAIQQLFNIPGKELLNLEVDLQQILMKGDAEMLQEKMIFATNFQKRLQALIDYLTKKVGTGSELDRRMQAGLEDIFRHRGQKDIGLIANQLGVSIRQIQRQFRQHLGMPPKLLSRIVRFQSSFQQSAKNPALSLTGLAYHCGYADQAHFTREFKEFAGLLPKQYFQLQEDVADSFARLS